MSLNPLATALVCVALLAGEARAQSDTFTGPVLDTTVWEITCPLGASTVAQDDELLLASDGTYGVLTGQALFGGGAGVGQKARLMGDFDIQVDFRDFMPGATGASQAFLNIYQDEDNQLHIKRIFIAGGPDGIQTVARIGGSLSNSSVTSPGTGTSGTLRVTRVAGVLTTYFDGALHTSPGSFDGDVFVSLILNGPGTVGVTPDSSVTFDDYVINSGTLVPPPVEVGSIYCTPAVTNSGGGPGRIVAHGSSVLADDDLRLTATCLPPGQFGYFLTSLSQGMAMPPGSQGFICLAVDVGRYNGHVGQGPSFSMEVDLSSMPVNPPRAALAGETWNFQCWYRDANPGPTSNFTDAVSVVFL